MLTGTATTKTHTNISNGVSVNLLPGEDVNCTFTNTKLGKVQVIKTLNGQAITGSETFTFTLRTGANATASGTVLETLVANSTNGGTLNFTTFLTPGASYQLCEVVLAGWSSSISTRTGAFTIQTEPDGDNSTICVPFTVAGKTNMDATEATQANALANTLDQYNNNLLCP